MISAAELVQIAIALATWLGVVATMRSSRKKTEDRILELIEARILRDIEGVRAIANEAKEVTGKHAIRINALEIDLSGLTRAHDILHQGHRVK